jgi:hypothetical protein
MKMHKVKKLKFEIAEMLEQGLSDDAIAKALEIDYSLAVEIIRVVEKEMFEIDMEYRYPYTDHDHIPDTEFAYITLMRK